MKEISIDSILNDVKNIYTSLEKDKRISTLDIKDYERRLNDIYTTMVSTKQQIVETFRTHPDKLIQFRYKEKIVQGIIQNIQKTFENFMKNNISDIDNNLDRKEWHQVFNNNQKEDHIQKTINNLNKFFK